MPISLLFGALACLIVMSGFFSSSETGMMSINRYRLRHAAKEGDTRAKRVEKLLMRPDRLIGVILIGNNLVNNLAAAIATIIAIRLYDEGAVFAASILLTLVVLIFSEVTPKTVAALHPEKIAYPASWVLTPLLRVLYPVVWSVNHISNFLARFFGVDPNQENTQHALKPEELRTVVDEAKLIPEQHQGMLLNVLDLEKSTIEDILIPRNEVVGIDLEDDVNSVLKLIRSTDYARLPVYEGDLNNVVGTLNLRHAVRFLQGNDQSISSETIRRFTKKPLFTPQNTSLPKQLMNFQREKSRMAVALNEYGEVQGIVTLEDLLEEIVGDFTTNTAEDKQEDIKELSSGWYRIEGGTAIRDINRHLGWELPTDGPKTLNGLLIEYLEQIPEGCLSLSIGDYRFEVQELNHTRIESANAQRIEPSAPEEA